MLGKPFLDMGMLVDKTDMMSLMKAHSHSVWSLVGYRGLLTALVTPLFLM